MIFHITNFVKTFIDAQSFDINISNTQIKRKKEFKSSKFNEIHSQNNLLKKKVKSTGSKLTKDFVKICFLYENL